MTDTALAALFFLQVAVILLVCRGMGSLAARVRQPQVVAEMLAGFLMGPSLLGLLLPSVQALLFPPATRPILFVVSQLGLVLYMFCVGLEFRADLLRLHARRAMAVSLAGILAPFAIGGLLAVPLLRSPGLFTDAVRLPHAVLFLGAAMAVTAFPILARIIYERGIAGTLLGTLALSAGAIDDAAAWVILAVVLGSFTGSATLGAIAALGGILYVAVVVGAARPFLIRLNAGAERAKTVPPWMLGICLASLAVGAWFTDMVGIYSVFGAFVLGAAVPNGLLSRELQRRIEPLTTALILPLFFVYSGLNSSVGLIDSAWLWGLTALILIGACVGKGVACWAAARLTGASNREALGIASLMNARGMMELILLNIGLQRGLITPTLFTMLVMMAIGTTLMAGPLFTWVWSRGKALEPSHQLATSETS